VDEGELFDNGQPWAFGEYIASCGATCGDGIVQSGEDCDDGNDSNADDCPTTCKPHRCGDGIVRQDLQLGEDDYEYCDDNNRERYDGCGNDCNRCGDGVVGRDELCDDGNEVVGDGCTDCTFDTCGNGVIDEDEQCDDGNDSNADTCSNSCMSTINCRERIIRAGTFLICPEAVTAEEARRRCGDSDTTLATIASPQINEQLVNISSRITVVGDFTYQHVFWIGIRWFDAWRWDSGGALAWSPDWVSEDHARENNNVWLHHDGRWLGAGAQERIGFICNR
jgi:cysteine-rich repeat protein